MVGFAALYPPYRLGHPPEPVIARAVARPVAGSDGIGQMVPLPVVGSVGI
jgi:hypothetical protein